ncbi:DoxX family protein [Flavobacteriaceae bacterium]|nr:DoxX family protein [Flavobacteriales bacterium]MBL6878078.1 DoxX family protein [Flavobacteriaceae bacterium]MDC0654576.1 DoxX family protein [Flavobacteriaceae bacterium]
MKYLVNISRILVGLLFIFSGLIKINDPVGFSFKLEEYFGPTVFNIDFLLPYVLPLAIFIVVLEVLLGVFLLIGLKKEFTIYSLFAMIVFFTFLTWYSAYFNKVTDCGCFGDAIKLTPWESFTKDVILLVLIVIIMIGLKYIKPLFNNKLLYIFPSISLILCILIVNQVLSHLPLIDFRPYKVGANIIDNMVIPEDSKKAVFRYDWLFNINGEKKVISTSGNFPDSEGTFVSVDTELIEEGYEPPILDFSMELGDIDYTDVLMKEQKLIIFVFYNISKTNNDAIVGLKETVELAVINDYKVIGLTASGEIDVNSFESENDIDIDFYFCDETALKTIVRSNPAAIKLHEGTIIQKTHWNDFQALNLTNL